MSEQKRLRVLSSVGAYLPAYKYGGPVRSLANLANSLSDVIAFRIVTRDRDLGDSQPFPNVDSEQWVSVGPSQVYYLRNNGRNFSSIRRLLQETSYDVLYLNSCFDFYLAIYPLMLRRFGNLLKRPTIIASRGALSPQGLSKRSAKKRIFLLIAKVFGLFDQVLWQATSEVEEGDIRHVIGSHARVSLAPNLPSNPRIIISGMLPRPQKVKGALRLIYVGRVSREKNLLGGLKVLAGTKGSISLSVYGLIDEEKYWQECKRCIASLPANIGVVYQGAVRHEEVPHLCRTHDMMFAPSWSENFGHGIFEALSVGCPVLIGDKTPWRQLEAANAGWDIPLADSGNMAVILDRAVQMGPAEFAALSDGAAAYAEHMYDTGGNVDKSRRLFSTALIRA